MATDQIKANREDTAIRALAAWNLHQHIWLPQTTSHEKLRVTFATTSNIHDATLPAVLFIGPMFGSRYLCIMFEKLALKNGVRVICTDRPAIGGSTPVPLAQRLNVWFETVPVLLEHLKIQHVSILTHSAGTLYTLNTLTRMPEILDPKRPFVAFFAPWVHSEHSKVALMNIVSKLPQSVFSVWSGVNTFVAKNIMPVTSWSGGVISSISGLFSSGEGGGEEDVGDAEEKYGTSLETAQEIEKLLFKYLIKEGMSGGNDEAMFCSRTNPEISWEACENYMLCMRNLASYESERLKKEGVGAEKLRVRLHFAESDLLIGKGGAAYFEKCWRQEGMQESVEVEAKMWEGSNHDGVAFDLKKGGMGGVLEEIGRIGRES